jgi:glycerol-3-phosphate dehydrogenase
MSSQRMGEIIMTVKQTRVLVVGGGVTGVGVIRDLALRNIDAVLIEQMDLAHGASSRFHGLLHSGARYAYNDPAAARECLEENLILKKIAPTCVENSGGFYLQHESDEEDYLEKWLQGCKEAGIEAQEVPVQEVLAENSYLTEKLKKVYLVPDATVDGSRLVWANAYQALQYGGKVLTYTKLTKIMTKNKQVSGAEVTNTLTGEKTCWECEMIINAAGTWADQVARLAGVELNLLKSKGSLLVFNQRFISKVFNRLRLPSDGDIIVPHNTVTILGTTSIGIDDPDQVEPTRDEINTLLKAGEELIPQIRNFRIIRAYAGVRPLFIDKSEKEQDGRNISRDFVVIDHEEVDGLKGLISLVGGKLTTYRLMAEKAVDYAAQALGENSPCLTAEVPLVELPRVESYSGKLSIVDYRHGDRAYLIKNYEERNPEKAAILCECENVSYAEVEEVASWDDTHNLDDLRRKTRIGMGTCQGLYCSFRSLGTAWESLRKKNSSPNEQIRDFLENRYRGQKNLLWDSQMRESELALGIYSTIFNLERTVASNEA